MLKSWKYLCSQEEVEAFLKKNARWECIEIEMTYLSTGNVESTRVAYHTVATHKLFLLERKFLALGVDPRELADYRQLAYEEGSWDAQEETEDI
jgi:hypothetical protein